jgi:hypothetical protein
MSTQQSLFSARLIPAAHFHRTSFQLILVFPAFSLFSVLLLNLCIHFSLLEHHTQCPSHPPSVNHTDKVWWRVHNLQSSSCNFLQPPTISSSWLQIFPSAPFSETLLFSFIVRHGFTTTQNKKNYTSSVLQLLYTLDLKPVLFLSFPPLFAKVQWSQVSLALRFSWVQCSDPVVPQSNRKCQFHRN